MNAQRIVKTKIFFLILFSAIFISTAATVSPVNSFQQVAGTPTATPGNTTEPAGDASAALLPTQIASPMATETPATPTPFPEWAMTSKDTDGLLFAGIFILVIIIVGTVTAMAQKPDTSTK